MLTICWLAGDRSPTIRVGRDLGVAEPGQQLADLLARLPALAEAGPRDLVAEVDVLGHVEVRDQVELLVDGGDALLDRLGRRGERRPSSPSQVMVPSSGWWKPESTLISVDLPAPFWPEQAVHLAGADVEVDAVERADARELLDDAGHLEQRSAVRSDGRCRHRTAPSAAAGARPGSGRRRRPRGPAAAPPRTAAVKPSVESSTRVPPASGASTPACEPRLDGGAHVLADGGEVAAEHDRRRVERVGQDGGADADPAADLLERGQGAGVAQRRRGG